MVERNPIQELRELLDDAYGLFGDALDAIQEILREGSKVGLVDPFAVDGVAAVAGHARNKLGIKSKKGYHSRANSMV